MSVFLINSKFVANSKIGKRSENSVMVPAPVLRNEISDFNKVKMKRYESENEPGKIQAELNASPFH